MESNSCIRNEADWTRQTYSLLIDTYVDDNKLNKKEIFFEAWKQISAFATKLTVLAERLIVFAAVEGNFFFARFFSAISCSRIAASYRSLSYRSLFCKSIHLSRRSPPVISLATVGAYLRAAYGTWT
jgi:hypothetical protein